MLFCLEFSKEDTKAAEFEFRSISHSDPQFQEHWTNHNGSVFHGDVSLYRSMAFVRKIGAVLFSFHKLEELKNCKLPEGKYYVRKIKLGSPDEDFTESMIGEHLQSEGRISFKTPDFVILAFYADMWYICKQEFVKNRKDLESRRAPMRPFFSPVTLHPKFARFMVNISGTKKGDTILDPFCGTGGILLEGLILGRNVIGNDSSLVMVKGARLNLKYYGFTSEIHCSDIRNLKIKKKIDAVVTDMPYGRSSPVLGDIESLYRISFMKFSEFLKPGGYCVIILENLNWLDLNDSLDVIKIISMQVHRSLTRNYILLRNPVT